MAIAFVQAKAGGGAAATQPATVTLDAAPTSGNLLVLLITAAAAGATFTRTGWTAGTLTSGGTGSNTHSSQMFWKISDGSETTTTVTLSTGVGWELAIAEYSGVDTTTPNIGETARANASGTNASGSLTPTASKVAIAVGGACEGIANVTWSAEAFTGTNVGTVNERVDAFAPSSSRASLCIFDAPVSSTTGAYSTSYTSSSANTNSAHIAFFQAAAAAELIAETAMGLTVT